MARILISSFGYHPAVGARCVVVAGKSGKEKEPEMDEKEAIEHIVSRVRRNLGEMQMACEKVRDDVVELHERFHGKGGKIPWNEAEILESMRMELYVWIRRVQTGEVVL